jgi:hypothetical protein
LVVGQLDLREQRILSLTVAVRRAIGPFARVTDLPAAVLTALNGLLASGEVTQVDGMYVLAQSAKPRRATGNLTVPTVARYSGHRPP